MQILVVDPNEPFASLLAEELKREGYDVDMCLRGPEALALARRQHIDLAVLDMALTNPDAPQLAKALREIDATTRLMLIPLMGETLSPQAATIDVQGVLPKPFFLPQLPGLIQAALNAPVEADVPAARTQPQPPAIATRVSSPDADSFGPEAGIESPAETSPRVEAPEPVANEALPGLRDDGEDHGICYDGFATHHLEVEEAMNALLEDVGADAVLLTFGGGLLTWVGGLDQSEAESISRAIIHGWRTSAEVARILGREQVRFEQSLAGGDYMLYALSVEVNAILGVAVRGSAPLGLIRHQARATVDQIARLCRA